MFLLLKYSEIQSQNVSFQNNFQGDAPDPLVCILSFLFYPYYCLPPPPSPQPRGACYAYVQLPLEVWCQRLWHVLRDFVYVFWQPQ